MDRRTYIGGSDAAAIICASPWRTPLQVYMQKAEGIEEEVTEEKKRIFSRGARLEPYVLSILEDECGVESEHRGRRHIHPVYEFIAAEIDAESKCGLNIEIKTTAWDFGGSWGDSGSKQIPMHYYAQIMHGMMVNGAKSCLVGALIGLDDFRSYLIDRDEDFIGYLLESELDFWRNVQEKNPPSVSSIKDINILYAGKAIEGKIEVDEHMIDSLARLKDVKARMAELEESAKEIELAIKTEFGSRDTMIFGGKSVATWKSHGRKSFDVDRLRKEHPDLYEKFEKTTSYRVLRIK